MSSPGALPELAKRSRIRIILHNHRPIEFAFQRGLETKPVQTRDVWRFYDHPFRPIDGSRNHYGHGGKYPSLRSSLTFTFSNSVNQRVHNFVWLLCLRCLLHLPVADFSLSGDGGNTKMSAPKVCCKDKLTF